MPLERTDAEERLARIERMMEEYRTTKQRQLLRRAVKQWREAEAQKELTGFVSPARVH